MLVILHIYFSEPNKFPLAVETNPSINSLNLVCCQKHSTGMTKRKEHTYPHTHTHLEVTYEMPASCFMVRLHSLWYMMGRDSKRISLKDPQCHVFFFRANQQTLSNICCLEKKNAFWLHEARSVIYLSQLAVENKGFI